MSRIEFSSSTGRFSLSWSFDGDYYVNMSVRVQGFKGHADGHVAAGDFGQFAQSIVVLSETRKGEARFASVVPDAFGCTVRSIDGSGHLAVFGILSFSSQAERAGQQRLDFGLEFEPSQIESAAKICSAVQPGQTGHHDSPSIEPLQRIEDKFRKMFADLSDLQDRIREKLLKHSDGKSLKGNELVGWLGEIYGKYYLGGTLVDDTLEHDFETSSADRVSVKARTGRKAGWTRTSAIPKIVGDDCPTHLLFVNLTDAYLVRRMWLYPWQDLLANRRFREHNVRGNMRSYHFSVSEREDQDYEIYPPRT